MKDWITKFRCHLIGWNYDILKGCTEASYKALKRYCSALCIIMPLWTFIGYSFAKDYANASILTAAIVGVCFAILVLQIEKQIILHIGHLGGIQIVRVAVAVIMALIGSMIIDQKLFQKDIEGEMISIRDNKVEALLPKRLQILDESMNQFNYERDSLEVVNYRLSADVAKNPRIKTVVSTSTKGQTVVRDSLQSTTTTTYSTVLTDNPKIKDIARNNDRIDDIRAKTEELTIAKQKERERLSEEVRENSGLLEELSATLNIVSKNALSLVVYVLLFGFFVLIELFILVSRSTKPCDYDVLVGHQLDKRVEEITSLLKTDKNNDL